MDTHKNFLIRLGEWWEKRKKNVATQNRAMKWTKWLPTPGNVVFTLVALGFLIMSQSVWARSAQNTSAASTHTISYQGRLADSNGTPLTGFQNLEFRIYDVPSGGVPLWEEFWTGGNAVQVSDGLFNVMLGSINNTLTTVIQGHDELYLGITVGTDSEMTPRVQLGSVPFSLQALTIPDGSVTAAKISDGAVTKAKLATGLFSSYFTTNSNTSEWVIPTCNMIDNDSSFYAIPGLSLNIELAQASTLFIDANGLITSLDAGKAAFTNIFVDGSRTTDTSGKALISGCRNSAGDGGGGDKWCPFSSSVAVNLAGGSHVVDVRAFCDSSSSKFHNGSLRVLVIP
ncbi:MAG: hypothetical protein H6668_23525 [Ardenticatenaceae bacterium]|nr:hypothetical protein [Ardenticatenaceae bacterium]